MVKFEKKKKKKKKKKKQTLVFVVCYGVCFTYSFIFVMNEGKYGRILKVKSYKNSTKLN